MLYKINTQPHRHEIDYYDTRDRQCGKEVQLLNGMKIKKAGARVKL